MNSLQELGGKIWRILSGPEIDAGMEQQALVTLCYELAEYASPSKTDVHRPSVWQVFGEPLHRPR
jgi:hypothetical protein